jgi:hypothetical protein
LNFKKATDEILAINDTMRYVRFIDEKGKLIHDKVKNGKILLQDQEGLGKFSSELPIIKQMQELFDESLGKIRVMHIIRDKVQQFVYYVDNMIIYVTCERNTDTPTIIEIVNKIDSILSNLH